MMDEEIRQALSEVREMKQMCGNINMKLTNIVTQRGQDIKKKLEAEYQRGLDDAWKAAKKIVLDTNQGGIALSDLSKIFGGQSYTYIMNKNTAQEAIAKLKAYEEKQKADDKIEVGDEVTDIQSGANFLVTHLWESNHGNKGVSGFNNDCSAFSATLDKVSKTGRHFDIASILKEMQS